MYTYTSINSLGTYYRSNRELDSVHDYDIFFTEALVPISKKESDWLDSLNLEWRYVDNDIFSVYTDAAYVAEAEREKAAKKAEQKAAKKAERKIIAQYENTGTCTTSLADLIRNAGF
jgi:hypothetical protein